MDPEEVFGAIERILEKARTAVLATVDADGRPRMRWMTPTILRGRPQALYAVTSPHLAKAVHLAAAPQVEWMFQTPTLNEVVNLRGRVNIVDNPSLRAEIIEAVGDRLRVFWNVSSEQTGQTDFIVLETVPEEASRFVPMTGVRQTVSFR